VGRSCHKCKANPADTTIKQNEAYCTPCLEQGMLQRVRAATKGKQLLATGDTLLVALSGGPASLALLYCLLQTQNSNSNRPERGKVAMQITPLHILPPGMDVAAAEQQVQQVQAAVESVGYSGDVYVVPLEALYQQPPQLQLFRATAQAQATQQQRQQQQQQQEQQEQDQPQDVGMSGSCCAPSDGGAGSSSSESNKSCPPAAAQADGTAATAAAAAAAAASLEAEDLRILMASLQDPTAREDVQQHLTQQLLLLAAHLLSCNKVLLGVTTTAIARHVIGEAAKGRGYSLAADIQLSDARLPAADGPPEPAAGSKASSSSSSNGVDGLKPGGGVQLPVVLRPLREVSHREVSELCRLRGWALPQVPAPGNTRASSHAGGGHGASGSINQLAQNFIAAMTDNLPASVYTILRTASHLDAFPFNAPQAAAATAPPPAAAAGTCRPSNGMAAVEQPALRMCRVCLAPLPSTCSMVPGATAHAAAAAVAESSSEHSKAGPAQQHPGHVLCYSCQRQVLGSFQVPASLPQRGGTQLQQLLSLLPPGLPWW
jgi:hypothetical protein